MKIPHSYFQKFQPKEPIINFLPLSNPSRILSKQKQKQLHKNLNWPQLKINANLNKPLFQGPMWWDCSSRWPAQRNEKLRSRISFTKDRIEWEKRMEWDLEIKCLHQIGFQFNSGRLNPVLDISRRVNFYLVWIAYSTLNTSSDSRLLFDFISIALERCSWCHSSIG